MNVDFGRLARNVARRAPVSTVLLGVMVAFWLLGVASSHTLDRVLSNPSVLDHFILYGPASTQLPKGLLSVFGSALVHTGITHLFMNAVLLLLIGYELERYLGSARYLGMFIVGAVGASAAVVTMDYTSGAVGASGVLYCFMVLLIGLAYRRGLDMRGPLILVLANLAFTFITPGISLWGHLGGLISGIALLPVLWIKDQRLQYLWMVVLVMLSLALIYLR